MDLFPLPTGMVVLTAIALAVAVVSHWRIQRFWRASLLSAVLAPILFLLACILQTGVPNPLLPVAFAYFTGFALLVAVVVGMAFSLWRRLQPVGA